MNIFQWLGAGGGVTAIAALVYLWPTIQKMRAEAGKARTDAAIAVDAADDAHWQALLDRHIKNVVEPLERSVGRLEAKSMEQATQIARLEERMENLTHRYRSAIGYIRLLLSILRQHHGSGMETPTPPSEIAGDI